MASLRPNLTTKHFSRFFKRFGLLNYYIISVLQSLYFKLVILFKSLDYKKTAAIPIFTSKIQDYHLIQEYPNLYCSHTFS